MESLCSEDAARGQPSSKIEHSSLNRTYQPTQGTSFCLIDCKQNLVVPRRYFLCASGFVRVLSKRSQSTRSVPRRMQIFSLSR